MYNRPVFKFPNFGSIISKNAPGCSSRSIAAQRLIRNKTRMPNNSTWQPLIDPRNVSALSPTTTTKRGWQQVIELSCIPYHSSCFHPAILNVTARPRIGQREAKIKPFVSVSKWYPFSLSNRAYLEASKREHNFRAIDFLFDHLKWNLSICAKFKLLNKSFV